MKKIIEQIHKLAYKATAETAKKGFDGITDKDVDDLAEAIELFNDIYEELYDRIFDDSESETK